MQKILGGTIHCDSVSTAILFCAGHWESKMRFEKWELERTMVWYMPSLLGHTEVTHQKELNGLGQEIISPSFSIVTCEKRKSLLALPSSGIAVRSKWNNIYKSIFKVMDIMHRRYYIPVEGIHMFLFWLSIFIDLTLNHFWPWYS